MAEEKLQLTAQRLREIALEVNRKAAEREAAVNAQFERETIEPLLAEIFCNATKKAEAGKFILETAVNIREFTDDRVKDRLYNRLTNCGFKVEFFRIESCSDGTVDICFSISW